MSNLQENYRDFHAPLAFGKNPALLMIDFVEAYLDPDSPLYADVETTLDRAVELLDACRKAGILIVHTNVVYEPGGIDGGVFFEKIPILRVFERGSPLGEFGPGLEPKPGELVISKQYPSAFFGTSLAPMLTAQGIDTVLIGGVTTSGCIRATAVDACQNGFRPFLVEEACGDRHEEPHRANLFDISAKYGEVISLQRARELLA